MSQTTSVGRTKKGRKKVPHENNIFTSESVEVFIFAQCLINKWQFEYDDDLQQNDL